jgi:hypothetical protein
VRKPDGTEVDVVLDKDLKVLGQEAETADDTEWDVELDAAFKVLTKNADT